VFSSPRKWTLCALAAIALTGGAALAQAPQLPPATPKPQLPDLDVTFIERTPRYPPDGDWKYADTGECIHFKEDPPVKHWPDRGEEVTFVAHVVNKGGAPSIEVKYFWMLDGATPAGEGWSGTLKPLAPGEEATPQVEWQWSPDPHRILFMADPENALPEICERNNCREDQTNAKAIMIRVHPTIAKAFDERLNGIGSYSFEDWIQEHFRMLNQELAAAVWPSTPNGCLERVRIDPFAVASTEEMNTVSARGAPYFADGGWQFHESPPWLAFALRCNFVSVRDDGLIHELAHQIGIIDNYNCETGGNWRDEGDPAAPLVCLYFRSRKAVGLMGTECDWDNECRPMTSQWIHVEPDTRVLQGRGIGRSGFSEWEAAGMNRLLHLRRGHFGLYLSELARNNFIRVVDRTGKPVAGAAVATYPTDIQTRKTVRKPMFTGTTDKDGLVNLGPRPFGTVHCIGINVLMLARVGHPSLATPEYHWLEVAEYNIANWKGDGERAVLDVMTGIGPAGGPQPPSGVRIETIGGAPDASTARTLVWEPSPAQNVTTYRVYVPAAPSRCHLTDVPMASRERPYSVLLREVPAAEHALKLTPAEGGFAFAVAAVDSQGVESSDAAAVVPPPIVPRDGAGAVRPMPSGDGKQWRGNSALLTTVAGKSTFTLARSLSDGQGKPATKLEGECVLRLRIRTKSTAPGVILVPEATLGLLAIRVSGTGGLTADQKEVGAVGPVSDGAWHDVTLDLKALLDKQGGKPPYTIGDILFGTLATDATPAEYELQDVVLSWR